MIEQITWEEYQNNKSLFGHVNTWALYDSDIRDISKDTATNNYVFRKDTIIANNEEEFFEMGLDKKLKKNIVFLGLNFSYDPQALPEEDNYNEILKITDAKERESKLREILDVSPVSIFGRNYGELALGNNRGSGYLDGLLENEDVLHGAYVTDLIKYDKGSDGIYYCSGVPESHGEEVSFSNIKGKEAIYSQVIGLKKELDSMNVIKPIIIPIHSSFKSKKIIKVFREVFGADGYYFAKTDLFHYSYRYKKKVELKSIILQQLNDLADEIRNLPLKNEHFICSINDSAYLKTPHYDIPPQNRV